jgi:hypothetical protein
MSRCHTAVPLPHWKCMMTTTAYIRYQLTDSSNSHSWYTTLHYAMPCHAMLCSILHLLLYTMYEEYISPASKYDKAGALKRNLPANCISTSTSYRIPPIPIPCPFRWYRYSFLHSYSRPQQQLPHGLSVSLACTVIPPSGEEFSLDESAAAIIPCLSMLNVEILDKKQEGLPCRRTNLVQLLCALGSGSIIIDPRRLHCESPGVVPSYLLFNSENSINVRPALQLLH